MPGARFLHKISVIIGVFNAEATIKKSLDSIFQQTYGDFECIVIDDGSTDDTLKILQSYRDPRLKVFTQKNIGLTKTLNKGLERATGEFIARHDGDDICLPTRFEKQLAFLEKNSDYVLVGSDFCDVDEHGNPMSIPRMKIYQSDAEIRARLACGNCFCHPCVMFRNLRGIRYDESFVYAQDYELWLRLVAMYKVANLPEVLVHKVNHGQMITRAKKSAQRRCCLRAKVKACMKEPAVLKQPQFWRGVLGDFYYSFSLKATVKGLLGKR